MEVDQETTSMLDDVFFIVKKCIKRAVGSNSVDGICAVINNACTLLESDFCQVLMNSVALKSNLFKGTVKINFRNFCMT